MKKQYIHTKMMIWSPKNRNVIKKKMVTWHGNHARLDLSQVIITWVPWHHSCASLQSADTTSCCFVSWLSMEGNTEGHIEGQVLILLPDLDLSISKLTFWHMMDFWKRNHQNRSARIWKKKNKGLVLLIAQHYQPAQGFKLCPQPTNQRTRPVGRNEHHVTQFGDLVFIVKVLLFRALAHSNAVPAVKGEVRGVGKSAICWKQDILLEEMKRLSLVLGFKYLI